MTPGQIPEPATDQEALAQEKAAPSGKEEGTSDSGTDAGSERFHESSEQPEAAPAALDQEERKDLALSGQTAPLQPEPAPEPAPSSPQARGLKGARDTPSAPTRVSERQRKPTRKAQQSQGSSGSFATLMERILSHVPLLSRLRISSSPASLNSLPYL